MANPLVPNSRHLRKTHRNLYIGIMGFGVFYLYAAACFFTETAFIGTRNNPVVAGFWFLVIGLVVIYGANFRHVKYAKIAMSVGVFSCLLHSYQLYFAFFEHTQPYLTLPGLWAFLGLIQIAPLMEPSINPVTMAEGDGQ